MARGRSWAPLVGLALVSALSAVAVLGVGGGAALAQTTLDMPRSTPELFQDAWEAMREARPGSAAEAEAFGRLTDAAAELGIRQHTVYGLALLLEAERVGRKGDLARARVLLDRSRRLAPELSRVEFTEARLRWREKPWHLVEVLRGLVSGWRTMLKDPAGWSALQGIAATLTLQVYAWLLVLLPALWWLGRRRAAAMDLRVLARSWLWPKQSLLLLTLLILGPAFVFQSPVLAFPAAAVFFAGQLRAGERVIVALLLVCMPFVWPLADARVRAQAGTVDQASRYARTVIEPCDAACYGEMERLAASEHPGAATLVLGWVDWRRGTPQARARANELATRAETLGVPEGALASLHTLKGHLAYAQDDMRGARQAYEEALRHTAHGSDRAALYVNLFRVASAIGDTGGLQDAAMRAMDADRAVSDLYLNDTSYSQNRVLAAVSPRPDAFAGRIDLPTRPGEPKDASLLFGRLTEALAFYHIGVAVLALLMGYVIRRRALVSIDCHRCGAPSHASFHPEAYRTQRCIACFGLDTKPQALSVEERMRRQRAINRHEGLWPTVRLLGAILLPGAPQTALGSWWSGLLPLVMSVAAVCVLVADTSSLLLASTTGPIPFFDGRIVIALSLWLPALTLSALSAWFEPED